MSVWVTGDIHGNPQRFSSDIFPEQKEMTKNDTVFIDGNHENFDRLDNYPVEEWHGGKVHFIRPSVIHLMRGQVFHIEDQSFFAFGGASSHDISDGILEPDDPDFKEKKKRLDKAPFALYRINHMSWWERELPSEEEMKEGLNNLAKQNNKVDYILTHSPILHCLDKWRVVLDSIREID